MQSQGNDKVFKIRRKRCAFRNCDQTGTYQPELVFPNLKGSSGKPLTIALKLEVCDRHRFNPKRAFISDEGYRHILKLVHKAGFRERPALTEVVLQFAMESGVIVPHHSERMFSESGRKSE